MSGEKMNLDISTILNDNKSGSYLITSTVLNSFYKYLQEHEKTTCDIDDIFEEIQSGAKTLIKHQSNMVLLRRYCYTFLNYFKKLQTGDDSRKGIIKNLLSKISEFENELRENLENVALNGLKTIANYNKILTVSNSHLVWHLLFKADEQNRKFEVFCLKSDPPGEGVVLAEMLAKSGIKTTLVADSQAGIIMDQMNMVLLGADRLYETGFVNKSGTLSTCLLAKQFNIPVYLAAETTKILKESERSIKSAERDASEVYNKQNNIEVINSYYEKIPLDLVQKVICEGGVFETPEFISWHLGE